MITISVDIKRDKMRCVEGRRLLARRCLIGYPSCSDSCHGQVSQRTALRLSVVTQR